MLIKLFGALCAVAATGTVLVYGFGLQVERPIEPLQSKQEAPPTTPKAAAVAAVAPVQAPAVVEPNLDSAQRSVETPANELRVAAIPASEAMPVVATANVHEPIVAAPLQPEALEAEVEQVFIFWEPFRSRGSAQGFAQGLSARAEVPISVIHEETDTGRQYRVVLPYDSEAQRLERLAKLELATRLEMGE